MKIKENIFRTDYERMFEMTSILTNKKLKHTPFLVLDDENGITLCDNALDLIKDYKPETKVLVQWAGNWSSDYILFDVLDVMLALEVKKKQYENNIINTR